MTVHEQTWDLLERVIGDIDYRRDVGEGWTGPRFRLMRDDESNYAVLYVFTHNLNTYRPEETRHTRHEFVVPVATYNESAWLRWVFDRVVSIEVHETAENFFFIDKRVFAPHHGNGEDPYVAWYDGHPDKQAKAPGEQ